MRWLALILLLPLAAHGQSNQCRTPPVGTSTSYCASEAFVTQTKDAPLSVGAFAAAPICASALEGSLTAITDSTTAVWGATIAGSGSNRVLAYCDGSHWTVAGK